MVRLNWSAEHVPMALATADTGYGEVQVLYNGQPTVNLHVTRVYVRNESSRDLTNVVMHLAYVDGTRILRSVGFQPGSLVTFPHSEAFNQQLGRALAAQPLQADIDYVLRNHEYRVPVLNRGSTAQFGLLVTRDDHARPTVSLDISHPGVKLDYREPGIDAFGVPRTQAQIAGTLLGLLTIILLIVWKVPTPWSAPLGWVTGAFILLIGAIVVKVFRFLGNLLS